ncbi:type VI secretion system-associated FHA domain protein TagH [Burkholderia gladioli]|uniref:type VI secretion system-associated FHA domain protein TagH n=1 Tax=Burkholderia gladioli TaxID=28095 RepID=UPI001A983CC0|nr:type VI secretion system-associated FHA domain protein TagH [Burkholderia gladioli]NHH78656.1 hypothetical protein [Burkholderia gladioli]
MSTEPSLTLAVQGERAERLAQREQRFDRRDGSIGRADDCDWVLGAEGVSRLHALIRYLNGLYFVEDRSTNGMLLNGAPLRKGDPAALRDGDRLQIDTFEIAVRLGGETGGHWQDRQAQTDRAPTAPASTSTPRVPPVPAVPAAGAAALSSSSSAENREPLDLGALLSPRQLDAQGDAGRPDGLIPGARGAAVPGSSLDPLALFDAPSSYYDEAPGAVPADQGWNHTPSPSDRFRPPRVAGARPAGALLPDDWDATGSRFTPPAAPSARQWDDSLLAPASNAAPAIPPAASGGDDSLLAPAPLRAAEAAPAMQSSPSYQDDARPGSSRAGGAAPVIPPSASREDDSLLGSIPPRAAGVAPVVPSSALHQDDSLLGSIPPRAAGAASVPPSSARHQDDSSSEAISARARGAAPVPSPSHPDDSLPRSATVAPVAPQHDDALLDLIPARAADAAPVLPSSALRHGDSLLAPIPAHAAEASPLAPGNPAARDQAAPSAARASAADAAPSTRAPAAAVESAAPVARPVAFGAAEASPRSQAASPAEPAGADLTAMFEIAVDAMMDVLRARAELKNSFRLPATLIQRSENNPLKFAPTAREAVRRLLAPPDNGFLAGSAALADAADDIRNHQMAMLAGVRSAFESLLAQFDPARIEQESEGGGRRLSLGGNRPRHWERYKEQFEALTRNPDECFRRLFGDEFARAYEEQLARLKQRRP